MEELAGREGQLSRSWAGGVSDALAALVALDRFDALAGRTALAALVALGGGMSGGRWKFEI